MEKQAFKKTSTQQQASGGFTSNANPRAAIDEREEDVRNPDAEQQEEESEVEDPDPVLDENDLEENSLSDEEADNIEWDPESGSQK